MWTLLDPWSWFNSTEKEKYWKLFILTGSSKLTAVFPLDVLPRKYIYSENSLFHNCPSPNDSLNDFVKVPNMTKCMSRVELCELCKLLWDDTVVVILSGCCDTVALGWVERLKPGCYKLRELTKRDYMTCFDFYVPTCLLVILIRTPSGLSLRTLTKQRRSGHFVWKRV